MWCISGSNKVVHKSFITPETCKNGIKSATNQMFCHKFRYLYEHSVFTLTENLLFFRCTSSSCVANAKRALIPIEWKQSSAR